MFADMLDEDYLRTTMKVRKKDGSDVTDQSAVVQTLVDSLKALERLHSKRPGMDLSSLRKAVGVLTDNPNAAVKNQAVKVQKARRGSRNVNAAQKKSGPPCGGPDDQDLLTGPVHPFGSLAALNRPPSGRLRAHSFASPPHDGFAFVEDGARSPNSFSLRTGQPRHGCSCHVYSLERICRPCKRPTRFFCPAPEKTTNPGSCPLCYNENRWRAGKKHWRAGSVSDRRKALRSLTLPARQKARGSCLGASRSPSST